MPQLLLFQRNNSNPSNDSGSYKIGDTVAVLDDAHVFSDAEQAYPFAIVNAAGSVADYAYLIEHEPAALSDVYPKSLLALPAMRAKLTSTIANTPIKRRKYSVNLAGGITRKHRTL